MTPPDPAEPAADRAVTVPPLPAALADPRPVLAIGTVGWVIALIAVVLHGGWHEHVGTCVAGVVLGGLGYGVFAAQRAASRRGSRTAQRGL